MQTYTNTLPLITGVRNHLFPFCAIFQFQLQTRCLLVTPLSIQFVKLPFQHVKMNEGERYNAAMARLKWLRRIR